MQLVRTYIQNNHSNKGDKEQIMTKIERIRHRRKIQRIRRIRRNVILAIMTFLLVTGLTLSVNVLRSAAQDKDTVITYKYYTSIVVEYGETLYSLAEEYTDGYEIAPSDYVKEVMHINHLEDETIQSGQNLIVPYFSEELKGI